MLSMGGKKKVNTRETLSMGEKNLPGSSDVAGLEKYVWTKHMVHCKDSVGYNGNHGASREWHLSKVKRFGKWVGFSLGMNKGSLKKL